MWHFGLGFGLATHTPSVEVGALYDFRTGMPVGSTYARTGAANGLTSAGLILPFAADVAPRTDRGVGLVGARTNTLTGSKTFTTNWGGFNRTISAGPTSPDGTVSSLWTCNQTGNDVIGRNIAAGFVPSTAHIGSVFVHQSSTSPFAFIRLIGLGGGLADGSWFNLVTMTVASRGANVTASGVVSIGGGWYWLWCVGTTPSSVVGNLVDVGLSNANGTVQGTLGHTLAVWQADLQVGSTPAAPIFTTSAAATCGLPTLTVPGAPGCTTGLITFADASTLPLSGLTPGAAIDLATPVIGAGKGRFAASEVQTLRLAA